MSDKLSRYNQKLLAIIGTLILVGLVVLVLGIGLVSILDNFRSGTIDTSLSTNTTVEIDPANANTIVHDVSFSKPRLIDTLNSIYLIRVSHVNTATAKFNNSEIPSERFSLKGMNRKYGYFRYSGYYNNIIIYDQKNNKKVSVFNSKACISYFRNHFFKNKQYLLLHGTTHDSNKDGKLKDSDLQSFYIYNIEEQKLESVEIEGHGLKDHYILYGTDEIVLRFGEDKDKDGIFKHLKEPIVLKKYSVADNTTTDLIDKNLKDKLHNLLNQ